MIRLTATGVVAESLVEVQVLISVWRNETDGVYAAEILKLGFGAYGYSASEATVALHQMLFGAVQARRHQGRLASWLEQNGLDWRWESGDTWQLPLASVPNDLTDGLDGWNAVSHRVERLVC